jgi:lipoprotein NlpI
MRALLSLLLMVLAGSAVAAQCQLVRIAEWPVTLERNQPVIEGAINGKKVGVLLDTGSNTTVIARSAAIRLGLERQYIAGVEAHGVGGMTQVEKTQVDEIRLGQAVREKWDLLVVGEHAFGGDIAVILGEDLFEAIDVELDLGNHVVRLFQPRNCERSPLAYWAPQAPRVEMDVGRSILVSGEVDGVPVRAMIDTGAARSTLATQVAAQIGITPSSPDVTPGGCLAGVGKKLVDGWIAPIKEFSLGGEIIHNPRIGMADMASATGYHEIGTRIAKPVNFPTMVLGVDFLLAHRVFVSHSQRAVYFTHNGRSPVFDTRPAPTCSERIRSSAGERIARYDAAVKEKPDDVDALYQRGYALHEKGDYDKALADYDKYLEKKRGDAEALARRASIWLLKGERQKARADYDAAVHANPALKLARRGRGLVLFYDGQYGAAQQDLAEWLRVDPDPYAALWLYLSQLRAGQDGSAQLFSYQRENQPTKWPAPIVRFQLRQIDAEALLAAAAQTGDKRKDHECEARFHIAESRLAAGDTNAAVPLLRQAVDGCPTNFDEYFGSQAELKRLGAAP